MSSAFWPDLTLEDINLLKVISEKFRQIDYFFCNILDFMAIVAHTCDRLSFPHDRWEPEICSTKYSKK